MRNRRDICPRYSKIWPHYNHRYCAGKGRDKQAFWIVQSPLTSRFCCRFDAALLDTSWNALNLRRNNHRTWGMALTSHYAVGPSNPRSCNIGPRAHCFWRDRQNSRGVGNRASYLSLDNGKCDTEYMDKTTMELIVCTFSSNPSPTFHLNPSLCPPY